ncbi:MAG TPA: DUF4388 domain-containing protein [Thermoanaerobaculia bacterium]|nr:DUF4388 domain-containing protein [Thermoanaerobaculia bacterium]
MEFSGRLSAFPLGDLLQWARNDRCTGALVIRRSEREKRIYFHAGEVVGCLSNDPAEFYGQHLLLHGYLGEDQLFRALGECTANGVRLGEALLGLGMLSSEAIQQSLRAQIEDVICDLFLWQRGIFFFHAEMPHEEEILPEPIDAMGLAMEGARWLDEVSRIRRVLVHDGVVLRRGERWPGGGGLPVIQQLLVEAVDGKRTLGDLHKKIRGSYFRFLESAFRLCVGMVLDIEDVQDAAERGTQEMSVYDLLLEQATEEQALVARRHMAVPLDLLERCYPVWVGEPSEEEQTRMPSRARDFYARFDGLTSLGDAFSGDPRVRGREMDLLLLQLQKGRLALLPAPVARLEEEAERHAQPAFQRWWRRVFRAAS